eukprot:5848027-Amphidinium_carterae.1
MAKMVRVALLAVVRALEEWSLRGLLAIPSSPLLSEADSPVTRGQKADIVTWSKVDLQDLLGDAAVHHEHGVVAPTSLSKHHQTCGQAGIKLLKLCVSFGVYSGAQIATVLAQERASGPRVAVFGTQNCTTATAPKVPQNKKIQELKSPKALHFIFVWSIGAVAV